METQTLTLRDMDPRGTTADTRVSLHSTHILSVLVLAAVMFPLYRMGSKARMQGKGGNQPLPPPVCSASNIPTNFISSFHAIYLHPKGHSLPLQGMECEASRCQSPNSWTELKGCSCSSGSGSADREDEVGQLGFLKADQCCGKITTASRNHRKASHHHCCANSHACLCFQTHDPAQELFYSQCMFPITLPINCWKYLKPWFSLHLTKTEAMCYCPSSHLHAGFFPLIISVFMLSKHQPGMSLAPPAAGQLQHWSS